MRFLLIDDHAVFRFGLRTLLGRLPGEHMFIEADSCEAAMSMDVHAVDPDVVVLDLLLPGINGMEGIVQLRQWCPTASIVLMSANEGMEWVIEGLRRGAQGFIPKTTAPGTMLEAMQKIMDGAMYMPSLDGGIALSSNAGIGTLTPRQRQVLGLLIQNLPNKKIATTLGMRVNTVRVHVAAIFRALNVDNRVDAARMAIAQGLVCGS